MRIRRGRSGSNSRRRADRADVGNMWNRKHAHGEHRHRHQALRAGGIWLDRVWIQVDRIRTGFVIVILIVIGLMVMMIVNERVHRRTLVMVMIGQRMIMSAVHADLSAVLARNMRVHASHGHEDEAHAQDEAQDSHQARHGWPSVSEHASGLRLRTRPNFVSRSTTGSAACAGSVQ